MISTRYAPALCAIFALALIPTLIHSYAGVVVTDDRTTAAIPSSLAGFTSAPSGRAPGWGQRAFESFDWSERLYKAGGEEVLLTVIRSYDLKRLYHHPELDVAYGTGFLRQETRRFPGNPDVPVHVLYTDVDGGSVAMYALHYANGFVESPLLFQIRTAGELLFKGRRPMTLIFARDIRVPRQASIETLAATRLLLESVQQFTHGARE